MRRAILSLFNFQRYPVEKRRREDLQNGGGGGGGSKTGSEVDDTSKKKQRKPPKKVVEPEIKQQQKQQQPKVVTKAKKGEKPPPPVRKSSLPVAGHRNKDEVVYKSAPNFRFLRNVSSQEQGHKLKGAASVSSLDSKHHKVYPAPDAAPLKEPEPEEGHPQQHFASLPPMDLDAPHEKPPETAEYEIVSVEKTEELETLRKSLATFAEEKERLAAEIAALTARLRDMSDLKKELLALKTANERIASENVTLRARLRGVAHSPLSDNEKRQLLQDPGHSSAPSSMQTEADGDISTPEWDKHSSSSLSEVSVACLQDRILQMEENHYSTNEELQATLQELADLQSQLNELQVDNERLSDEKAVLLESLCTQTEKLEDTRTKALTLQELLLREGAEQEVCTTEREQKLVLLLKSAQIERENLLQKQEELTNENLELRESLDSTAKENEKLHERMKNLESSVDSLSDEAKQQQAEAKAAKELASARHVQLQHVSSLLDDANAKISMIEKNATDINADQMTAALQRQIESLQEQLLATRRQQDRLSHRCSQLQDEAAIAKTTATTTITDLEYQCEQLKREKEAVESEYVSLQDVNSELQLQRQCLTEERRSSQSALADAQRATLATEQKLREVQSLLNVEISERERDAAEWKQFQSDLLMTVRVANDFKTEAQRELEKLVLENKSHREKVRSLENQIEQLKGLRHSPSVTISQTEVVDENSPSAILEMLKTTKAMVKISPTIPRSASVEESGHVKTSTPPLLTSASLQDMMTVQRRNNKLNNVRQDSRLSVKSLIESIENAAKQAKAGTGLSGSLDSSNSSFGSLISAENADNNHQPNQLSGSPLRERLSPTNSGNPTLTANGYGNSSPTSKLPTFTRNHRNIVLTTDQLKSDGGGTVKSPKLTTTTNMTDDQTSSVHSLLHNKALETFVRRNSYSDLSDRKDPLNGLVKNGGSKRNALLKWCQNKTIGYRNIDITNFSSSWNDGLALCALLHTYLPSSVPYDTLHANDKKFNFSTAFAAAESVGIPTTLDIQDMIHLERPDWQQVMAYVTAIYKHFET